MKIYIVVTLKTKSIQQILNFLHLETLSLIDNARQALRKKKQIVINAYAKLLNILIFIIFLIDHLGYVLNLVLMFIILIMILEKSYVWKSVKVILVIN